ncbi:NUDIX domain-containing protein [Micromonospora zamorensis]|uniref:NUDIX domain-containing protein n=1 Tax=Micromonospora zamorensis TaxID=709883 RepID=UPI0033CA05C1
MATYGVALVLLVDPSGAVLLQHRDEDAPASPGQWSLPGGHIEPGESPGRRPAASCWRRRA